MKYQNNSIVGNNSTKTESNGFYIKEFKTVANGSIIFPFLEEDVNKFPAVNVDMNDPEEFKKVRNNCIKQSVHEAVNNDSVKHAELWYEIIDMVVSDTPIEDYRVPGYRFLFDDYAYSYAYESSNINHIVFCELVQMEVPNSLRRLGIGTLLFHSLCKKIEEFKEQYKDELNITQDFIPIISEVGVLIDDAREKFGTDENIEKNFMQYMHNDIVPFFESLGFTNMNDIFFAFETHVAMVYPKNECIRMGEAYDKMYASLLADPTRADYIDELKERKINWKDRIK